MKNINAPSHGTGTSKVALAGLALAALGVVFGDIGTSVLYAMNEIFFGKHSAMLTRQNELGATSLAIWALTIIVAIKYVMYVLRADNDGEGGVFALLGLLRKNTRTVAVVLTSGFFVLSAGLLFGDGLITPAISVLSAVEGLKVAAPALEPYIVLITVFILVALFAIQYQGTGKVGKFFGPIITVWFCAIALLGLREILHTPGIFYALNPWYGITFLRSVGFKEALFILGALMLVVTGGEALFADMGHFGRAPIRLGWFAVVYPALILNYMGQGAYMLSGQAIQGNNLFYSLVPAPLLYPMIILATMATIIASQALISGVFSLVSQGVGLGLFPRVRIIHTHAEHEGQIYVPFINWALLLGCVMLVVTFRSSTNLASAYGLAVAGDMLITSMAMILISRDLWHWSWIRSLMLFVPLVFIDASFLTANSLKFLEGGFVPLGIGLVMFVVMKTWQWGRTCIREAFKLQTRLTMSEVVDLNKKNAHYFPRSVVVLTSVYPRREADLVAPVFQAFWDRYQMMPRHLIMLNIKALKVPHVLPKDRYELTVFENDGKLGTIAALRINYGYMEMPDFADALTFINEHPDIVAYENLDNWLILAARERLLKTEHIGFLDKMRYTLFRIINRNAIPTYSYYGLGDDLRLATIQVPVQI